MRDYRRSAHTLHAVHCHFVFCTKYRKPVLRGEIGQEVRKQIQQICQGQDVEILQGHVRPDHVHLLLGVPPHLSPSRVMQAGEREKVASVIDGPSAAAEGVLGTPSVGSWLLRREQRECDG